MGEEREDKPMRAKPKTKANTIDEYLAPLSNEKRAALEKLRRAIQAAAPKAEECISYGVPAFRLGGRMLVAFGAAAKHCAGPLSSNSPRASISARCSSPPSIQTHEPARL